jgi:hypothetical protein
MAERRLRPLGLGDIFDEGFDLYKKNFALLALVAAVVTVPLDILMSSVGTPFFMTAADQAAMNNDDPGIVVGAFGSLVGKAGADLLISSLIYALPLAALAAAASARYLGQPASLRQSYRLPLRRLASLLGTAFLFGLAIMVSFDLCFFPVVWFVAAYLFTAHVFVAENKGGLQALKRSSALFSGSAGRIIGTLILLSVIFFVLASAIEVPLAYAFDALLRITPSAHALIPSDPLHAADIRSEIVQHASSGIADLLILPFVMSVVTVLYYDLRIRKEAFDIEMLAHDLGYSSVALHPAQLPPAPVPPAAAPGQAGVSA